MNRTFISIIALMVVPISGLSIDIYVPSLPYMAKYFQVSNHWVQNTISVFLVGYAISQLFAGIICDMYGRRIITIISLILYISITAIVLFSQNIQFIWICRCVQGFMVGFFASAQRAIIVDLYKNSANKLETMANNITIAWSIGPIIAPVIGGYIQHLFSWKANFIFLIAYAILVLFLVIFFVPETLENKIKVNISYIFTSYITILNNRSYNYGYICNGLIYLVGISFSTIGSFLVQDKMGYSSITFGYCALLLGIAWFIGQVLNKILTRYSIKQRLLVATSISILVAIIALIWSIFSVNLIQLVLPIIVLNILSATVFANYFIRNSLMFTKYAGNAGALQGAGLLIVTSIGGFIINQIVPITSAVYLMIVNLIIYIIVYILTRKINL